MTLDEAIQHSLEVANSNKCIQCAEEHKQLAEWLIELKTLREDKKWIPCGKELPAEDGMYLATIGVKWSIPRFRWVDRCFFSEGVWLVNQENAKVYAWMKLPHRYEGN